MAVRGRWAWVVAFSVRAGGRSSLRSVSWERRRRRGAPRTPSAQSPERPYTSVYPLMASPLASRRTDGRTACAASTGFGSVAANLLDDSVADIRPVVLSYERSQDPGYGNDLRSARYPRILGPGQQAPPADRKAIAHSLDVPAPGQSPEDRSRRDRCRGSSGEPSSAGLVTPVARRCRRLCPTTKIATTLAALVRERDARSPTQTPTLASWLIRAGMSYRSPPGTPVAAATSTGVSSYRRGTAT